MPKVSVIIAAYNIENYITRCLDSIINQTFHDIEIIVVNDGSRDKTLEKVKYKATVDKRIKIIDKKNEGSIEARKDGFKKATGEYILFIDGDDYIDNKTISILYDKSREENYDIVCFKSINVYENGSTKKRLEPQTDFHEMHKLLKLLLTNKISPSICFKFIKRSFIVNNHITFPSNISYAEDLAFSCALAIYNPKVCMIDEYLYYYFNRQDSITRKITPKILETITAFNFILEELYKKKLNEKYKEEYEYLAYIHNYYYRRDYIYEIKNELSKIVYKEWRKMDIFIYNNKYYKNLINRMTFKERVALRMFERLYFLGKIYHLLKKKTKQVNRSFYENR